MDRGDGEAVEAIGDVTGVGVGASSLDNSSQAVLEAAPDTKPAATAAPKRKTKKKKATTKPKGKTGGAAAASIPKRRRTKGQEDEDGTPALRGLPQRTKPSRRSTSEAATKPARSNGAVADRDATIKARAKGMPAVMPGPDQDGGAQQDPAPLPVDNVARMPGTSATAKGRTTSRRPKGQKRRSNEKSNVKSKVTTKGKSAPSRSRSATSSKSDDDMVKEAARAPGRGYSTDSASDDGDIDNENIQEDEEELLRPGAVAVPGINHDGFQRNDDDDDDDDDDLDDFSNDNEEIAELNVIDTEIDADVNTENNDHSTVHDTDLMSQNRSATSFASSDPVIEATIVVEDDKAPRSREIVAMEEELKLFRNQTTVLATAVAAGAASPADQAGGEGTAEGEIAGTADESKKRRLMLMLCVIVVVVIGIVIGVVVALSGGGSSSSSSSEQASSGTIAPTPSPVVAETQIPTVQPTNIPTAFPTSAPTRFPPSPPIDEWPSYSALEFAFDGVIGYENRTSTQLECEDTCGDLPYVGMGFFPFIFNGENNCFCYIQVSCLARYDDFIQSFSIPRSNQLSRFPQKECSDRTFCDSFPGDPLCYTQHSAVHTEFTIFGDSMTLVSFTRAAFEAECVEFCAGVTIDVIEFRVTSIDLNNCYCYVDVDCFLPWGEEVNTANLEFAQFFTKPKDFLGSCSSSYCDEFPSDAICFSGNALDTSAGDLHLETGTLVAAASTDANNQDRCLEFCKEHFAAKYIVNWNKAAVGLTCTCYDQADCILPWGDDVEVANYIPIGKIFSKGALPQCDLTHCQVFTDSEYCFTANQFDYRKRALTGANLQLVDSASTGSEMDCLNVCGPYSAVQYTPITIAGDVDDNCLCYDNVDCLAPWGPNVDAEFGLGIGTLYTKESKPECGNDFCTTTPTDYRCFTGNEQDYRSKQLHGDNIQIAKSLIGVQGERECLRECELYPGAEYFVVPSSPSDPNCVCYEAIQCGLLWGNVVDVNNLPLGSVYTKEALSDCANTDFCVLNPADSLCVP